MTRQKKNLNLLFFVYSFLEMSWNFQQTAIFYLGAKAMALLNLIWKFKKKKKHFKWSYLKYQDKFILKTQIFWKFIQFHSKQSYFQRALPMWVHGGGLCFVHPPPALLLDARSSQRLVNEQRRNLNLLFFVYFFGNELKHSKNFFFTFG